MAFLVGELELAEIAQKDRLAFALGHYNRAHVVECLDQTQAADDKAELAARHDTAARAAAIWDKDRGRPSCDARRAPKREVAPER